MPTNIQTLLFGVIKLILTATSIFAITTSYAQAKSLYELEKKIEQGDIIALKKIGKYLDSSRKVVEYLGHHHLTPELKDIAQRIIEENSLFTNEEWELVSEISLKGISKLLLHPNLHFDSLSGAFLITPLSERKIKFEVRELSPTQLIEVDSAFYYEEPPYWYAESKAKRQFRNKDPKVLLTIASQWFQHRSKFNKYYFNDEEFINANKALTHVGIGIEDEKGRMSFLLKDNYSGSLKLSYLIYWLQHYKEYQWNDSLKLFVNKKQPVLKLFKEEELFQMLSSKNDSIAKSAYVSLAEMDVERVTILADEYDNGGFDFNRNRSLSGFTYRFLKQMVRLTKYCRENNIRYKPTEQLNQQLDFFAHFPSSNARYNYENYLIDSLNVVDITMIEYWNLLHSEQAGEYSIGRIIDKVYSNNWNKITSDQKQLSLYLKKSKLFDELGIVGNCNRYLNKFLCSSPATMASLLEIISTNNDADIIAQAKTVIGNNDSLHFSFHPPSTRFGTTNHLVKDLTKQYQDILDLKTEKFTKQWKTRSLLSNISYEQIGEAIRLLEKDTILNEEDKYDFLKNDFGINTYDDSITFKKDIKLFERAYSEMNELQLYKYYLDRSNLDYKNQDNTLDYTKIYKILKYDIAAPFIGGGMKQNNGVFLLIRVLELSFNTTFGFPSKLCGNGLSCDPDDRAEYWMRFFEENKLVTIDSSPPSLSREYDQL